MADSKEKLFSDFPAVSTEQWMEKITADLKGADFEKKLVWRTNEGFKVKPFYRQEDLEGLKTTEGLPGEFPYVRGTKKNDNTWFVRQEIKVECPKEANAKALDILNKGVDSLGFYVKKKDLSPEYIETLLNDICAECIELNFSTCQGHTVELAKLLVAYFQKKGYDLTKLQGSVNYDPMGKMMVKGKDLSNFITTAKELVEVLAPLPKFRCICVNAIELNNAGSYISTIKETLMDTSKNGFGFSRQEADHVMKEIQNMDVKTASEFLESQYGYYNAIYAYEDLEIHKGTAEEINHYIERKLSEHSFSWYFAKKFTDFAGLHMAFFATVLLSFLFIQDTRKSTYELLHTKPVTAIQYICGKVISGFISMLGVLVILNVIFFMLCLKTSLESGFPVTPIDFCVNSLIYIVPNLLMICCVYTITAVIFKNPLPAAPILFLHIIYSNMLTMKNDIYYMRPFSIMVRFPGRFFETHAAKMSNINQIILVISSVILVCISVTIWKRRRVH